MSEKNSRLNINYVKRDSKSSFIRNNKKWNIFVKIFWYWFLVFIIISFIIYSYIYSKYLSNLPSVKDLENLDLSKTSTIYDRNWNELYKIFKEKRTYVWYSSISQNMVHAIVAWEDKKFFTNPWVDIPRLIWAVVNYWLWRTAKVEWTSTITQQLVRNTIIANEKSVERKIKEMYLSYKVSQSLSKEKILELYLNKISYWSNAYWIEQASRTFFWKNAKDLGVFESSVLASLPKWPTQYSPYRHPDRLLWYPYLESKIKAEDKTQEDKEVADWVNDLTDDKWITKILTKQDVFSNKEALNKLTTFLNNLKAKRIDSSNILICSLKKEYFKWSISIDSDWCSVVKYENLLDFLNNIKIKVNEDLSIEYQVWRKDFILWRMLEDWYIEFDNYKRAIVNSIAYEFKNISENVKYNHFVFYVKEYLEKKYWKELIEQWWLEIYTTLDSKLQDKAQELITKATNINWRKYWASNSALVSIDNTTGEILTMVWWKDYSSEWDWNVNIITSKLQPWSSFKPFVYSLAMYRNPIWTKTPVYDLKTKFPWGYDPKNFDGKFQWKMNVSTALNGSRNIPAVKMFFLAWWVKEIVPFMNKIWVNSLQDNWQYWPSLALWAWELTPLELASAYSVFANLWEKKEITPILKILDSKKNIIEESKQNKSTNAIDPAQAYLINSILSDTSTRPSWWNPFLTLKWRKVAAKTWTSTKESSWKWKKIYPANLWTIWYTPQITTVVWSWNTNWKETKMNWDWLNVSWPIWRDFMEFAHKWKTVLNWKQPASVKIATISSITWYLSSWNFWVVSLFKNLPKKKDWGLINKQVDILCNWKIWDKTPPSAIKTVSLLEIHSEDPSNPDWERPVQEWIKNWWLANLIWENTNFITYVTDEECVRDWASWDIQVSSSINSNDNFVIWNNYVEISYNSPNPVQKLIIFIDNENVQEINIANEKSWTYKWNLIIPDSFFWSQTIKIQALDSMYYTWEDTKTIQIWDKIKTPPSITVTNPSDFNVKIYNDQIFTLQWQVNSTAIIKSINFYLDWKPLKLWLQRRDFAFPLDWKTISPWNHEVKIEAVDTDFNIWTQAINLEVLVR